MTVPQSHPAMTPKTLPAHGAALSVARADFVRSMDGSRRALQAEARRTEVLIGELLGQAHVGTNQHNGRDLNFKDLNDSYRATFRFFAANAQHVQGEVPESFRDLAKLPAPGMVAVR